MKQIYLLTTLCAFSFFLSRAQNAATPNPGFENWILLTPPGVPFAYDSVKNWQTLNYKTAALGTFTASRATGVDKHSGQYAIKLVTKNVFSQTANGITSTGNLITVPPYGVDGGIAYSDRPDSIVGWYKNTVVGGDTAFIELRLTDATGATMIGYATFDITSSHTAYSRFSAPVGYSSAATPALSIWLLSSSARIDVNRSVNSTLFVDDIDLVFNTIGITEQQKDAISVYFNNNQKTISVCNIPGKNYFIIIHSVDGKTIAKQNLNTGSNSIETKSHSTQNLFYSIFNNKGEKIKGGQLAIK